MKLPGKFFITLLSLLGVCVVVSYFLLQTQWGAGKVSRYLSDKSGWSLSVDKIEHNFSAPRHLILNNVRFGPAGQPAWIKAKQVDLGLALLQFSEPLHFASITLQDGSAEIHPQPRSTAWSLQADRLVLKNMQIDSASSPLPLHARQVSGSITPWLPDGEHPLGRTAQFQLGAEDMALNAIAGTSVQIQGSLDAGRILLRNIAAEVARGSVTGSAERDAQGGWRIHQLHLSDLRWQTPQNLADFLRPLNALPDLTIENLDLTGARLQGADWALTDLDLTLKNLGWHGDDWSAQNGSLTLNASNIIAGSVELNDPLLNLSLTPQGVTISQFSSRWSRGVIRADGSWQRSDKHLLLNNLAVSGLEYTLPLTWRDSWQAALPAWLNSVQIARFTASRNLIIAVNPDFPFQMTSLAGNGDNLWLARQHQWGIWGGNLSVNAAAATFNRVDLQHPSLALSADDQQIQFHALRAVSGSGLLEGTATVGQQIDRPLALALKGQAVSASVLQNWGWPTIPASNRPGNFQLRLNASLRAGRDMKTSANGTLTLRSDTGEIHQQMQAGELR